MAKCDKCGHEEEFDCGSCQVDREHDQFWKAYENAKENGDWLTVMWAEKYIKDMLAPRPWDKHTDI